MIPEPPAASPLRTFPQPMGLGHRLAVLHWQRPDLLVRENQALNCGRGRRR